MSPFGRTSRAATWPLTAFIVLSLASSASARQHATLDQRIQGADHVVVATAASVAATWRTNEHGDRIIVSRVLLQVEEALKGGAKHEATLDIEGGTLDGVTLKVSGVTMLRPGERAVLFLNRANGDVHTTYLRGQGVLPLVEGDVVRGTNVRLDDIKSRVRLLAK